VTHSGHSANDIGVMHKAVGGLDDVVEFSPSVGGERMRRRELITLSAARRYVLRKPPHRHSDSKGSTSGVQQ